MSKKANKPKSIPSKPTPKPAVKANTKQYTYLAILVLILITGIVFLPSLSADFVNWDDAFNVYENASLKPFATTWSWSAVKQIFSTHVIGNYNPLPIFTFAIEQYFFAPNPLENPFPFHLNNVCLHLACTLFVFLIFNRLGISKTAAFIGALLFGIHPMRVESVSWITERKDVLYGLFFLATLYSYLTYIQTKNSKKKWYFIALLCSVFSYFSKVQAVTIPLSMVAIDIFLKRDWKSIKIAVFEKLPWWLLSLIFGLINIYFLQQANSLQSTDTTVTYSFVDKLAVGAYAYAIYTIKWIFPYKMSPLYPYEPTLPIIAYVCLIIVPILLLGSIFITWRKKLHALLFGILFFTFNVMFLLQIVGAGQGFLADRFTYIAYIGLFFITSFYYDKLVGKYPTKIRLIQLCIVAYLCLFAYLTIQQQKVWQNGGTLWEKVKSYYPNSPTAWKNAAEYYRDTEKNRQKAIENYQQALMLQATDATTYNNLAKAYTDSSFSATLNAVQRESILMKALTAYNQAIINYPPTQNKDNKLIGEMYVNRGAVNAMLGKLDTALLDFNKGLSLYPNNLNGYSNRAILHAQMNRFDLALKDRDAYIMLQPSNADMYYERGVCYVQLGKNKEALLDFNKAIALNNANGIYYVGRAHVQRLLGNTSAQQQDVATAKQLGAQIPEGLMQ